MFVCIHNLAVGILQLFLCTSCSIEIGQIAIKYRWIRVKCLAVMHKILYKYV